MIYNRSARCLIAYGPLLSQWYVWVRLFFPVPENLIVRTADKIPDPAYVAHWR